METIKEILSKSKVDPDQFPIQVMPGKVVSINENNMTCEVDIPEEPNLQAVRIRSIVDGSETGLLLYPKIDSRVLVGIINNREESAFICTYGEIEKYRIIVNDIELSGSDFGGLIKISELISKLNNIENAVNQLKSDFNTHTHNAPQAPSGTLATLTPLVPSTVNLTTTKQKDLENENVKHG